MMYEWDDHYGEKAFRTVQHWVAALLPIRSPSLSLSLFPYHIHSTQLTLAVASVSIALIACSFASCVCVCDLTSCVSEAMGTSDPVLTADETSGLRETGPRCMLVCVCV